MNYSNFTPDSANITDLRLDQRNPRIGKKQDQNQCISAILDSTNFINLVNDIAKNGIGLSPIVVYESDNNPLVVMDGNRRITALKLLSNPSLAKGHALQKKIEAAADLARSEKTIPKQVPVQKSSDLKAIHEHMRITHAGELDGVGQKRWTAMAQALFAIEQGIDNENIMAAKLVLFAHDSHGFNFDDEYSITILTRLINKERLSEIGLSYESGTICWKNKSSTAEKVLLAILTDIRDKNIITDDVRTLDEQDEYLNNLYKHFGLEKETVVSETTHEEDSVTSNKFDKESNSSKDKKATSQASSERQKTGSRTGRTPDKPTWDRKHVVHRGRHKFDFTNHPDKLRNIYVELSNLVLDGNKGTPISAAFAIRAFVELATSYCHRKYNLSDKNDNLARKVRKCAEKLNDDNKIDDDTKEVILKLSNNDELISIRSLHKYIHSTSFHPDKQKLNTFWDQVYPFLAACLKA